MFNFDDITKEDIKEHNPNWPKIPDHPYRISIVAGSGSRKTIILLHLINNELDIDKIYLYAKDAYKAKYKLLINERESTGLKYLNDSKSFIEYSNDMAGIYKNIEEYNLNKKRKILIVFDDMIADMLNHKKPNPTVTKLFTRRRKLNISLAFITQSYFAVSKKIKLNSAHYIVMKIPNKRELQQIAFNHLSDINFQNFMNLYESNFIFFLIIDTTLASDNSSRIRKNLL